MARPVLQRLVFLLIVALVHAAWFAVLAVCLGHDHDAHALVAGRSCAETHHGHDQGDHQGHDQGEESGPDLGCPSDCGRGPCVDLAIDLNFRVPGPLVLDGPEAPTLVADLELPRLPHQLPPLAFLKVQAPPLPLDPLQHTQRLLL